MGYFSAEPYRCDLPLFDGVMRLSEAGAMPEPEAVTTIGELPCSDGRHRPLERLHTNRGPLLTLAIPTPHHSLY